MVRRDSFPRSDSFDCQFGHMKQIVFIQIVFHFSGIIHIVMHRFFGGISQSDDVKNGALIREFQNVMDLLPVY